MFDILDADASTRCSTSIGRPIERSVRVPMRAKDALP
jgi:hypothetical protein